MICNAVLSRNLKKKFKFLCRTALQIVFYKNLLTNNPILTFLVLFELSHREELNGTKIIKFKLLVGKIFNVSKIYLNVIFLYSSNWNSTILVPFDLAH